MKICIIGKFPPIQGGVSMQTYWSAHGLAARGHDVHVVTNAKEVRPPFRMHMRDEDWQRCDGRYGSGSVTVHWTAPADASQYYIPMASPYVSKLATVAAGVHRAHGFDVIFSHYMEPYAVAGHLAAEMIHVPHVVRMAGSDAGKLWHHPQFEALYDHVLSSADIVIAAGGVAERATERGVDPQRIASGRGFPPPASLYEPRGSALDLANLRAEIAADPDPEMRALLWGEFPDDRPYFGICGKLGASKGTFALLAALHKLKRAGREFGLVALAHGTPQIDSAFRAKVEELGLTRHILQLPFLPHWRVPEFLRSCRAVCCLEQDFLIDFHSPVMPLEVLLSGTCLIASTEMIRKLPNHEHLPNGYGCVAIDDVNDIALLSARLSAILEDPAPAASVATRGFAFAKDVPVKSLFVERLEKLLATAAARELPSPTMRESRRSAPLDDTRFPLTRLAAEAIGQQDLAGKARSLDLADARELLSGIESRIANGNATLIQIAPAVRLEVALATAEEESGDEATATEQDPLFRLRMARWAMEDCDLAGLYPVVDPRLRIITFDYDVAPYRGARTLDELPARQLPGTSYLIAFPRCDKNCRDPLLVDGLTVRILGLSDGTHRTREIAETLSQQPGSSGHDQILAWIEQLFVAGLLQLQEAAEHAASRAEPGPPA